MRLPSVALSLVAVFLLGGCPPIQAPGDVQYGEYTVEATRQADGCSFVPDTEEGSTFTFWARLGADLDGETAYLTVAQPPDNVQQRPRQGDLSEGAFRFQTIEVQDVSDCGCLVRVTETLSFVPVAEATDGGSPDAGDEGVPGLPLPQAVTGVEGEIAYQMESTGNCPAPEYDADGGLTSGCVLPCRWGYDLVGDRQD